MCKFISIMFFCFASLVLFAKEEMPDFLLRDAVYLQGWDICFPGNVAPESREVNHPLFASHTDFTILLKDCPTELSPWGEEVTSATRSLFSYAKNRDLSKFKECFTPETPDEKITQLYHLCVAWMTVWGIDVPAVGKCKYENELFFSAVVSYGNDHFDKIEKFFEPGNQMTEFDWIKDRNKRRDLVLALHHGFSRILYWKKRENSKYLLDLEYSDGQLNNIINLEVFSEYVKYTLSTREASKFKKKAEKRLAKYENYKSTKEYYKNMYDDTKECAYDELKEKYGLKIAEMKLKKIFSDILENNVSNKIYHRLGFVKGVRYAALSGNVKVLEKPIIFSNVDQPFSLVENPTMLDELRYELYDFFYITELDPPLKGKYSLRSMLNINAYELFAYSIFKIRGRKYLRIFITGFNEEDFYYNYVDVEHSLYMRCWRIADDKLLKRSGVDRALTQYDYSRNFCWGNFFPSTYQDGSYKRELTVTGKDYHQKLIDSGLYPFFHIRKRENCIEYKPGMKLLSLPVLSKEKVKEILSSKEEIVNKPDYTPTSEQERKRKAKQQVFLNPTDEQKQEMLHLFNKIREHRKKPKEKKSKK